MPHKPMTPCRHPGCPALVPYGQKYCEKHKALHPEEIRSAAGRGYDSRWNRARKEYLKAHPLCVECMKDCLSVFDKYAFFPINASACMEASKRWQPYCSSMYGLLRLVFMMT